MGVPVARSARLFLYADYFHGPSPELHGLSDERGGHPFPSGFGEDNGAVVENPADYALNDLQSSDLSVVQRQGATNNQSPVRDDNSP